MVIYRPESLPGATVMLCIQHSPRRLFLSPLPQPGISLHRSIISFHSAPGRTHPFHLLIWSGMVWVWVSRPPGLRSALQARHTACVLHHSPSDAWVPSHVCMYYAGISMSSFDEIIVLYSVRLNDIMGKAKPQRSVLCNGDNAPCWGIMPAASRLW